MSAKAMQENGNEKRLLISVRRRAPIPARPRLQLLHQLRKRERRATRPLLLLLVELLEADRQRAFRQADPVANLAQIVGILCVALLVTRVVEMQEKALVRQIRLQHPRPRVRHPHRQRMVVHLEDDDVLQLVALLLADVNFAARETDRSPGRPRRARSGSAWRDRRCCCAVSPAPPARHRRSARDKSPCKRPRAPPAARRPASRSRRWRGARSIRYPPRAGRRRAECAVSNPHGIVKMSENGRT